MASSLTAQAFAKMLLETLHCSRHLSSHQSPELARFDRPLSALFERLWSGSTDGNACIELDPEDQSLLQQSGAHVLIGEALPLVLDEQALYLNRFWHAERRLADHIHRRLGSSREESSTRVGSVESLPSSMGFPYAIAAHVQGLAAAQLEAVQVGLSRSLSVIYGGPGTGKTRTIASLILSYAELFKKPIWVAAPTAKAGGRLMESLRALLLEAMPKVEPPDSLTSSPLRTPGPFALPSEALTIQRLLSQLPSQNVLFRDHDDPQSHLEAPGLLIIDEASMLSLELCEQVFASLSPDCSLVLVGDPEQLHSVETGSVFAALCEADWPALKASRVQLTRNFRQSNRLHLSALADKILRGRIETSIFGGELVLKAPDLGSLVEVAAQRYASLLREVQSKFNRETSCDQKSLSYLEAVTKYRLLSARRSGMGGADRLSELVLYRLKKLMNLSDQTWFEGRVITIIKNDPGSGLLNGDVGVCIGHEHPQALVAFFRHGNVQTFPAAVLPRFQDAYCLSVHQSQGSEFEHVDFIAAPAEHQLATRELLYTAVTRAKNSLSIWGELEDLQWAASHPTIRQSRLRWRIDHP